MQMTLNKNNKKSGGVTIGTSLVLVTFVVLCLVTFATLSYSLACSDMQLTRNVADRTKAYYEADANVQVLISDVNTSLMQIREISSDNEIYMLNVSTNMWFSNVDSYLEEGVAYIEINVPIDAFTQIAVKLKANDISDNKLSTIISYKNEQIAAEEEDEGKTLNLLF